MIKTDSIIRVSVVLILMVFASSAQATTVHIDDTSASISSIVDVSIRISDASDVGVMEISLTYDPNVLTALGIVNAGDLTSGALVLNETTIYADPATGKETISEADNQTVLQHGALANHTTYGVVNVSIITRYGFSGTGSVAVVRFSATGLGVSPLNLSKVAAYNISAPVIDIATGKAIGYESIPITTQNGSVVTLLTCNISLATGWNLISVPLNLTTWKLGEEAVVGDPLNITPENSLTSIYRYNTTSGSFEKCSHYDDWGWYPATGSESFTELEPARGYWVMAKNDCNLTFTGTAPSDLDVSLDAGWNCVGWYSMSEALLGEEVAVCDPLNVTPENSLTSIYRYNTTSGSFEKCSHYDDWGWWHATGSESFTELEPGRGYWVMADNDCVWGHEI